MPNCLFSSSFYIALLFMGYFPSSILGDWVAYSSSLPVGAQCVVKVGDLHPTQFAIGYWEIEERAKKVTVKSGKKLLKYLEDHVGKVIVGPNGDPYIIDRHHLASIMLRTGKSATILATVEANFKNANVDSFWNEMISRKWVYLYDGHGKGPLDPRQLPKKIKDLEDDPFRSLAWAVREQDGYHESKEPFAEFSWANFFRKKLPNDKPNANMEQLIKEALKICHMPEANGLPGYFPGSGAENTAPLK
jgi:hypothetical protein